MSFDKYLQLCNHYHSIPCSSVGKESACKAGDPSSIPGLGRSLGEGKGYLLQYSWVSRVANRVKNLPPTQETLVQCLSRSLPWRREWQPTPIFFPGKFQVQRSLAIYSPLIHEELDMTEWLTHTPKSLITLALQIFSPLCGLSVHFLSNVFFNKPSWRTHYPVLRLNVRLKSSRQCRIGVRWTNR